MSTLVVRGLCPLWVLGRYVPWVLVGYVHNGCYWVMSTLGVWGLCLLCVLGRYVHWLLVSYVHSGC